MNKKNQVLEAIYEICKKRKNFIFDNELVKEVSKKIGFGNPFDATKIDNKSKLPKVLLDDDVAVIHLGRGRHQFIKGINKVYHDFEPIQKTIQWKYKKSLLNEFNSSESNILSVANNQRILHHFLFGKDTEFDRLDIGYRPKTYFPHRTKTSFSYNIGKNIFVEFENIQIEIDLTIEYQGVIGVFEGKNGNPDSFAIYQIYHPFLYYHHARQSPKMKGEIKQIYGVYVVRTKENGVLNLKLWAYTFKNPLDISTIQFVKSVCYQLNIIT
jgi:hypothetical protein